jgi:phosphohistidine phosphatase
MNRWLIVFRHGKSDWNENGANDHERPLKTRGKKAASRMGRSLSAAGQIPDRILCSSAVRTLQTMQLAARVGAFEAKIEVVPELYGAGGAAMEEIVRQRGEESERLLVCGHEPGCSELIARLTGANVAFPTAAMARIDLDLERWEDLDRGRLAWLLIPKLLR